MLPLRPRAAVEITLGGDLPDTSWLQATTGVTFGGLGFGALA